VRESVDEVLQEIREYRAGILATSYQMDRGEFHVAAPEGRGDASSVVPFPSREER
jgi:flagellar protein FlbD